MEEAGLHCTSHRPLLDNADRRPRWLLLTTGTLGAYLGSTHCGPIIVVIDQDAAWLIMQLDSPEHILVSE